MILAVTGIFLLLPLLLTVFLSGREVLRIKKQWNMESLLPMMMCREIPWEYEEEMKKVVKENQVFQKEVISRADA